MNSDTNYATAASGTDAIPDIQRTSWRTHDDVGAAVAEAVSNVTGRAPTDLEPLQYTVDVDALHALCSTAETDHLELTFSYEGVEVRVTSHGDVEVTT